MLASTILYLILLSSLGVNAWLFITRMGLETRIRILEQQVEGKDIHDAIQQDMSLATPFGTSLSN